MPRLPVFIAGVLLFAAPALAFDLDDPLAD